MVSELLIGAVLTAIAWLGLLTVTIHAKIVIGKIAHGTYDREPLKNRE